MQLKGAAAQRGQAALLALRRAPGEVRAGQVEVAGKQGVIPLKSSAPATPVSSPSALNRASPFVMSRPDSVPRPLVRPRATSAVPSPTRSPMARASSTRSSRTPKAVVTSPWSNASHPAPFKEEANGAVDWTFQRSSKMQTTPGELKATEPRVCPVCGSPRKLDANGLCVYCKTPGPPPKFDWLLVQMESAPPDLGTVAAGQVKRSGRRIGILIAVIVVASVGLPILIALLQSGHHTTTDIEASSATVSATRQQRSRPAPRS